MNFSQSSDTDYKPSRGRHASAAQQNNNIFGFESNQVGQDQMFPPNRVKASADEEKGQGGRGKSAKSRAPIFTGESDDWPRINLEERGAILLYFSHFLYGNVVRIGLRK